MKFPDNFLQSLEKAPGYHRQAFEDVHASGELVTSVRVNPAKPAAIDDLPVQSKIPWTEYGYYLSERPSFTFDPLFHAGTYYVQDASSMFLETALKQTVDLTKDIRVLDLCGAPGGKSTHIQSLITPGSLLVSNEVIRARGNILRENIIRWGCSNVIVSHNDPSHFSSLEHYFDVMVVDAPCSGSGLFRKDPEAMDAWSIQNVQLCSQRQQRILADAWPALKPGGVLIYATCSYAVEEDEQIGQWIRSDLGGIPATLEVPGSWNIVSTNPGYRFWPNRVEGEGFYLACFRKETGEPGTDRSKQKKINQLPAKEREVLSNWIEGEFLFTSNQDFIFAWPAELAEDIAQLTERLRASYTGILLGEFAREKLLPSHALAMSPFKGKAIPRLELDREQAIHYLQKKEITVEGAARGWQLASFRNRPMGWVNVLPNRINNYYPKDLRILKTN